MADLKEARRLLGEVSAEEPAKALEDLAHWLESVRREESFKPEHRAQVLLLIDEAGQVPARKLGRDYLAAARLTKVEESRVWTALHEFWKQSAAAFAACIEAHALGVKGADSLKGVLPLLGVRALRALGSQLKWLYVRYGPLDEQLWQMVTATYSVLEAKKASRTRVAVYPGIPGESTPEQEFLRVAMFGVCSPHSLLPTEIEVAERLIAHFSRDFGIAAQSQAETPYWIDLAQGNPPTRYPRPLQQSPNLRFFGSGSAFQALEALGGQVRSTRSVPADVNLGGTYPAELVTRVLDHLVLHWSPRLPERRHQRHRVKSRLTVAWGFDGVLDVLDPGASIAFDASIMESWIVENVSAGGFGALVPQMTGDWLRIGCLLALQPEGGDNWLLGVVRRLSRTNLQQANVGIQTLARSARPVDMRVRTAETTSLDTEIGIVLNPDQPDAEVQLVVRPGVHAPGQSLLLERGGQTTILLPLGVSERGQDYEMLRCRRILRESAQ